MGGREESAVPRDPTLSTIQWSHGTTSGTNSHVARAAIRIPRFGDSENGNTTEHNSDSGSLKMISKVR